MTNRLRFRFQSPEFDDDLFNDIAYEVTRLGADAVDAELARIGLSHGNNLNIISAWLQNVAVAEDQGTTPLVGRSWPRHSGGGAAIRHLSIRPWMKRETRFETRHRREGRRSSLTEVTEADGGPDTTYHVLLEVREALTAATEPGWDRALFHATGYPPPPKPPQ